MVLICEALTMCASSVMVEKHRPVSRGLRFFGPISVSHTLSDSGEITFFL